MIRRGGKITIGSLKNLIEATYKQDLKEYKGYQRDDQLSTMYTKVYYNPTNKILIVSERPTHTARDVLSDVLAGIDLTGKIYKKIDSRIRGSYKTFTDALNKYNDRKNSILIGYSLGAIVAQAYSRDHPNAFDEVILVSKPVLPSDILHGEKPLDNVTEIRSELDATSALKPFEEKAKREKVIKAESWNPIEEHKIKNVLTRVDQDEEVGDETIMSGIGFDRASLEKDLKKMKVGDLRHYIVMHRKKIDGYRVGGKKKKELVQMALSLHF